MTDEISNRTLAYLLIAAIVISLTGTFVSMNRLGKFGPATVSGAAVLGNVSLQVSQDTTINVTDISIDFGSGAVTGGNPYAILNSNATAEQFWSGIPVTDYLTVQNDGNIDLNITFQSTHDASTFIGGTDPNFNYTVTDNEAGSCQVTPKVQNKDVIVAPFENWVCHNLSSANGQDSIDISVLLKVPDDTGVVAANATFTFTSWVI